MSQDIELERQLKIASKTGKYVVGRREVMSGVKGSSLLVWSASANVPQKILDDCRTLAIPAVKFKGNPVELGRACGIPFRVSVIAVKSAGDADLDKFSNSADYGSAPQLQTVQKEKSVETEPVKEAPKKTKTVRKRKPKVVEEPAEKEKPVKATKTTRRKKTTKKKEESN